MYQVISNFRGGLDARKYKLSLPPGTLTDLVNGHITAGGEVEKRLAYVKLGNGATTLPAGTFGMQETSTGIVVFGSADMTGQTLPTPFSYQRLQHPAVLAGTAYDAAKHAMTGIVHSADFGSGVAAVAEGGFTTGPVWVTWVARRTERAIDESDIDCTYFTGAPIYDDKMDLEIVRR